MLGGQPFRSSGLILTLPKIKNGGINEPSAFMAHTTVVFLPRSAEATLETLLSPVGERT